MAHQFIFTMKDLRKVYPPDREVLKGIWLSFFPGAKIGVLGSNGAGKSTLLRIMAGVETDFLGEAWPAEGTRVGYLPQEPQLDPDKDVLGNVDGGRRRDARRSSIASRQSARSSARRPTPTRWSSCIEEQAKLQDGIDAANAWELDRTRRDGDGRAARPARRRRGRDPLRRRAPPGRALPAPAASARPAAPRRADQPPRRRVGRLARALPPGVPRHRRRRSRTTATSSTTSPAGSSSSTAAPASRGRATTRPGSSRSGSASAIEEKQESARRRTLDARARVGAHGAARAPGQEQGAPDRLRELCSPRRREQRRDAAEIVDSDRARASATSSSRREALRKGYGDGS